MSRQYDAKQSALKAYPDNRQEGIDLFLEMLTVFGISESDFEYGEGMTVEEYIYGSNKNEEPQS